MRRPLGEILYLTRLLGFKLSCLRILAEGYNSPFDPTFPYSSVVTISPEKDVFEALVTMRNNDIRHLPVVKGNELLGFLTLKDVLKIQPELFDILLEKVEAGISLKGL